MKPRVPLPPPLSDAPFTYRYGRDAGAGATRLRGADLTRPFHGVRDPTASHDLLARCLAYATKMSPSAFFSSATAARLMGAPLPRRIDSSEDLHVAIVAPHRGLQGQGVVGHKVRLMGNDSWEFRGVRLSTPERAWCELGRLLTAPELVAVGDHLIHWRSPLVAVDVLADAIDRYPDRRGKPRLQTALGLLDPRAESPKESELRAILQLAGIEGIVSNHPIVCGGHRYRLDLAIPRLKIDIEYQGDYHRDPTQWRSDMTRRSRIESSGWYYLEFNADDLRSPAEIVARVATTISRRERYPQP